jgi:hypothetical protein
MLPEKRKQKTKRNINNINDIRPVFFIIPPLTETEYINITPEV